MNEFFEDRPAPWRVEKHRTGIASVVDASNYTVVTVRDVALAEFVCDAANAYATDEYVFVAASNNADKIAVLTAQRDEAREQLAAAQARIAELANELDRKNDVIEGWRSECAEHADARATAEKRIEQLESALRFYAENPSMGEIARAALAGVKPATRGE